MISVNSPFYFDRDRLRRWYVHIPMWRWRRHEFEFPEIFLLSNLRSGALEFVIMKCKNASVPSEETAYNVRPSEVLRDESR